MASIGQELEQAERGLLGVSRKPVDEATDRSSIPVVSVARDIVDSVVAAVCRLKRWKGWRQEIDENGSPRSSRSGGRDRLACDGI